MCPYIRAKRSTSPPARSLGGTLKYLKADMGALGSAGLCLVAVTLLGAVSLSLGDCSDDYKVNGGGSTALKKFVSDGVSNATQDANYKGVSLPFYTVGSSVGVQGFMNNTYDYAITDSPLSAKDFKAATRSLVQIPFALGAVSAFYNIPGYGSSTLRLSGPVASGIWGGSILYWDDPAILSINPNLTKLNLPPQTPIHVVVRNDSAVATTVWTKWLTLASNGTWQLGSNNTIYTWPAQHKQVQSASNVAYAIGNTSYSIGVLDVYTGKNLKLNDSALQIASNASSYLRYSKADFNLTKLGFQALVLPEPTDDWGNFSLVNLGGNATFPVMTMGTIITSVDLTLIGDRGRVQKQLFSYLLGPVVQNAAGNYQEFKLPPKFLARSIAAVSDIKTADGKVFFQPTLLPTAQSDGNATNLY